MLINLWAEQRVFQHIARLAVRLTGGRAAVFARYEKDHVVPIAAEGIHWGLTDPKFYVSALGSASLDPIVITDVRRDARLRRHPLLQVMPLLRALICLPISWGESRACIMIFDPALKGGFTPHLVGCFAELSFLAAAVLDGAAGGCMHPRSATQALGTGREDEHADREVVGEFLFDTLVRRPALRTRRGYSYITVAHWRTAIKKHQIQALKRLKVTCPPEVVRRVAEELAWAADSLIGNSNISHVTSVPCGHSCGELCFSDEIAKAVATKIGSQYVAVFKRQVRSGSSHPRKNRGLTPYQIETIPSGSVLLIDDVATSGAHFEAALRVLKPRVEHVAAMAWIGDK